MAPQSTRNAKPMKPYPNFPLFPHATKRWSKKILGKSHYFGPWDDPDGALQKYLDQKDDLHAGRKPRESMGELTVADLCNRFLSAKRASVDSGELVERTWEDYREACELLVASSSKAAGVAGLRPDDFQALRSTMAKRWGPTRLVNVIGRIKSVFRFADENDLIERPVKFGSGFKPPSRKVIRKARAAKGTRVFEADEVRAILDAAPVNLRAMILLGVNAGLGNGDLASLPKTAIDLEAGWLNYPRPKTGIPRRCWLWPETVEAIRAYLEIRPKAKDLRRHRYLLFLTRTGGSWAPDGQPGTALTARFAKLLDRLGLRTPGRSFYSLRRTFRTVASGAMDEPAANTIMGHAGESMAALYVDRIVDDRLRKVAQFVRAWLWPAE
ncbi:MAG: tyrosine-type recombinase/integrase [Planctomycetes bacterium]|nr:tyrosine-type recombinase/integrase [Planctomycetota bacterium]